MVISAEETLDLLMDERPKFHVSKMADEVNHALADQVLYWLANNVEPGQKTLETGCGYSTVVLAAAGAEHTAIAPAEKEFARMKEWSAHHGISFDNINLELAKSQDVLPSMEPTELDVVLIDGDHGFPFPMIDWYYTCQRLNVGGQVILDDTQCRAVRVLYDFLSAEAGRWEKADEFARSAVFRKLVPDVYEGVFWRKQPWGGKPITTSSSLVRRWIMGPTVRTIKRSDKLTQLLLPIYREKIVKRKK